VLWDLNIGAVGFTSREAHQHKLEIVSGLVQGSTIARYYPGGVPVHVKLLFEHHALKLVGAQIISRRCGIKERNELRSYI
jgi:NADH oxidase (H2O2-forming)